MNELTQILTDRQGNTYKVPVHVDTEGFESVQEIVDQLGETLVTLLNENKAVWAQDVDTKVLTVLPVDQILSMSVYGLDTFEL